jgi:uncharacterized protein (UPF0261 family)
VEKVTRMAAVAEAAVIAPQPTDIAVAVGGGTGGEIGLAVLRRLPGDMPKVLVTTLAFDPRVALADMAVTLVPTFCDLEGLNATLRQVFENTAAMVAGLARAARIEAVARLAVAVTTLGATGAAGAAVTRALAARGCEATVFHANGYGGAALCRFVAEGRAAAMIDLNVHELGRMHLAGAHVPMPDRFTVAAGLPRVVLPGALNFLGLGSIDTLTRAQRARPHYRHSGHFTHVKLTESEMTRQTRRLAQALNLSQAPCHVLIPMGGFSHEDRPGGAIEDATLREIAADTLERAARAYSVARLPDHINAPETATAAVDALLQRMPDV